MACTCNISYTIYDNNADGSGSGSFIVTGSLSSSSKQTTYTYTNLKCSRVLKTLDDFTCYDVDVTFTLNNEKYNENYTLTGRYNTNDQKVDTTFNSYGLFGAFNPTSDPKITQFLSSGFEGTILQGNATENKVNCDAGYGAYFILTQKAAGTTTNLSGFQPDGSSPSTVGIGCGPPILCQAYVACLVQVETELNVATLVDAIGIGVAGLKYTSS